VASRALAFFASGGVIGIAPGIENAIQLKQKILFRSLVEGLKQRDRPKFIRKSDLYV
jgi:hypothetical protein